MARDLTKKILETFTARAQHYETESSWMTDLRLITPLVPAPFGSGTMLDVCAGTGALSRYGIELGWCVHAADVSIHMLRSIPAQALTVRADARRLPYAAGSFDLLCCRQGLQYLNIRSTLKEFARVSRREIRLGHITLEHADDESFWVSYFRIVSPGRRNILQPGQLSALATKIGFRIVEETVIHTRGTLNGSLKHLDASTATQIRKSFALAPKSISTHYEISPLLDGDYEYSHRWEFVTLLPPTRSMPEVEMH